MKANKLPAVSKAGLAAAILTLTLNGLHSKAQNLNQSENSKVAARLIRYEVKPEFQTAFREAISNYILYSLKTDGNILSEAYYEEDKPSVLWIIERWSNKTELDKISNSVQFKKIDSLSERWMLQPAKTFYVKDLEPLSKHQWRSKANKEDKPITVMLFVDSKVGTENNFTEVYHAAMPQFRSEAGVINYQLSQLEEDSSRFVTYEKFRNEEAFQYHLNFPPIKPVIEYLNTSIKKQPFQTGLHKLIEFAPLIREE
jgi:quinol monooxygenase YgiN